MLKIEISTFAHTRTANSGMLDALHGAMYHMKITCGFQISLTFDCEVWGNLGILTTFEIFDCNRCHNFIDPRQLFVSVNLVYFVITRILDNNSIILSSLNTNFFISHSPVFQIMVYPLFGRHSRLRRDFHLSSIE